MYAWPKRRPQGVTEAVAGMKMPDHIFLVGEEAGVPDTMPVNYLEWSDAQVGAAGCCFIEVS